MVANIHKKQGFTIVELLIVIVVISILAAIVIVSYTGIQTRAKNTKTVTAVNAWVKGIRAYQTETGLWPTTTTCLGGTATYTGDGKCWSNSTWTVASSVITTLQPRLGNPVPEPDITPVTAGSYTIRGGRYDYSATPSIYYVLSGVSDCPQITGISQTLKNVYSDGVQCGGAVASGG